MRTRWSTVLMHIVLLYIIALSPLLFNSSFYFLDDAQTQFINAYREIGHSYLNFEVPFLSDRVFNGDNYLIEYQYGLFNPLTVALSVVMYVVPRADIAVTIFAATYLSVTYFGILFLARKVGLRRDFSVVAAVAGCCLPWLIHISARSWAPTLAAFAYFPWFLAFAVSFVYRRQSRADLIGLPISLFLLLTAGWPQTVVAAAASAGIVFVVAVRRSRNRMATAARMAAGLTSGVCLAAPAMLPLAPAFPETARFSQLGTDGLFQVSLEGLAAMSGFSYLPLVKNFSGAPFLPFPSYYAGLFVVPFVLIGLTSATRPRWDSLTQCLALLLAAMATLCLLPNLIGPLRWSMRWLIHFQLIFVLVSLLLAQGSLRRVNARAALFIAGVYFFVCCLVSVKETPQKVDYHTLVFLAEFAIFALIVFASKKRLIVSALCVTSLLAGHLILIAGPLSRFHMPDYHLSLRPEPLGVSSLEGGSTLFLRQYGFWRPLMEGRGDVDEPGMAVGGADRRVLAGYSAVGHNQFRKFMCMETKGSLLCPEVLDRMFAVDPGFGVAPEVLFKVDHVLVEKGSPFFDKPFAPLEREFQRVGENKFLFQWDRTQPSSLPGTVSFLPPSYVVSNWRKSGWNGEEFSIAGSPGSAGALVFSRLFWPGYQVLLNGRPLELKSWNDILLTALLPENANGVVRVEYIPAGFRIGLILAFAGLVILLTTIWKARLSGSR